MPRFIVGSGGGWGLESGFFMVEEVGEVFFCGGEVDGGEGEEGGSGGREWREWRELVKSRR